MQRILPIFYHTLHFFHFRINVLRRVADRQLRDGVLICHMQRESDFEKQMLLRKACLAKEKKKCNRTILWKDAILFWSYIIIKAIIYIIKAIIIFSK